MIDIERIVIWRPSPNFGERRGIERPELVILHYTAMRDAESALQRLCAPEFEVSAHYLIAEDGTVYRLVADEFRAWHAGAGRWRGQDDLNSRSIGIELANPGDRPFPNLQIESLERLLAALAARFGIPPRGVIGHSDFAFGRKIDPGPRFDWRRLALGNLSVWPGSGPEIPPDARRFREFAERFGYPAASTGRRDEGFAQLLQAFRWRFRPWKSGPLDAGDMSAMADLAERFG